MEYNQVQILFVCVNVCELFYLERGVNPFDSVIIIPDSFSNIPSIAGRRASEQQTDNRKYIYRLYKV